MSEVTPQPKQPPPSPAEAKKRERNLRVGLLGFATFAFAGLTVFTGTQTPPNVLATSLLQGVTVVFAFWTPYVLAKYADADAATEVLKTHAKPAFRRTRGVYRALGRCRARTLEALGRLESLSFEADGKRYVEYEYVRSEVMASVYALDELVRTSDDVLQDWHDLVPDEVERIMREVQLREEERAGEEEK